MQDTEGLDGPDMSNKGIDIRWCWPEWTSALYAAHVCAQGCPLAADRTLGHFPQTAQRYAALVTSLIGSLDSWWPHVLALSAQRETAEQLVEESLARAGIRLATNSLGQLVQATQNLYDAFVQVIPDCQAILRLRARPLQELWATRGPGLMHYLKKTFLPNTPLLNKADTDADVLHVVLVHPLRSMGGGSAYPVYRTVIMEAMLVNPMSHLPETLRLAWLLGQLLLEPVLKSHCAAWGPVGLPLPVVLIPPILEAAEYVEWATADTRLLQQAAQHWCGYRLSDEDAAALWQSWRVRGRATAGPDHPTTSPMGDS
jgi:hypothetical protein